MRRKEGAIESSIEDFSGPERNPLSRFFLM